MSNYSRSDNRMKLIAINGNTKLSLVLRDSTVDVVIDAAVIVHRVIVI